MSKQANVKPGWSNRPYKQAQRHKKAAEKLNRGKARFFQIQILKMNLAPFTRGTYFLPFINSCW